MSLRTIALPLALALAAPLVPMDAEAGPLMRRVEERRACQQFASKLQEASGNPAMAQQVYQQGVLQLVAKFGENPCGDIFVPAATPATTPSMTPTPGVKPASQATTPATQPSSEQQQACQQFASKLQAAAASGGAAAAQQTYAMGTQKLTGMFGPNPCPNVKAP